jgi:excisionase family DNA binding protein
MESTSPITNILSSGRLLYSREEAAEILSLSVHTVARDIRLGRISARHYGRRVLIPREEILRIASEGMQREPAIASSK